MTDAVVVIGVVAVVGVAGAFVLGHLRGSSLQTETASVEVEGEAKAVRATTLGELHALLDAGVIDEEHVVAYVKAKIKTEEAQALSMVTHARSLARDGLVALHMLHAPELVQPAEDAVEIAGEEAEVAAEEAAAEPVAKPVVVEPAALPVAASETKTE